jgi:hypothetical protein
MLRPKYLEIWNVTTVKTREKNTPKSECLELEPNPSKDRAMKEEDSPSFWNENFPLTVKFQASTEVLYTLHMYMVYNGSPLVPGKKNILSGCRQIIL